MARFYLNSLFILGVGAVMGGVSGQIAARYGDVLGVSCLFTTVVFILILGHENLRRLLESKKEGGDEAK